MRPGSETPDPGGEGLNTRFRFDGIVVDAAAHTLVREGREQALEPKAFAVLLALLQRPGELLGRDALLDQVWGHRHVTPGVLTRAIAQLRAALDDDSQHPRYIQTQHALGYRFIGTLEAAAVESVPEPAPLPEPGPEPDAVPDSGATVDRLAAPVAEADTTPRDGGAGEPVPTARAPRATAHRGWAFGLVAAVLLATVAWWLREREAAQPPAEATIAVLPFTTLSDARDDRYFAEGLSMELLDALAGVEGLTVAAWRPPEAIDRGQDLQALGRLLGVAMLLDASVRRDGRRLRINARLSDTRTGYTVWSRSYDGDADSIFDTQADIADAVVDALLEVVPEERDSLRRRLAPTRNSAAFGDYLSGLAQLAYRQGSGNDAGARFRKALATDPAFAKAQAGVCRAALWSFEANYNPAAFESARLACLRARNMDGTLGEVSLAMGDLYRLQGEPGQALKHYESIIDDPALRWQALVGRARVRVDQGQEEQAMQDFRQALQASPGNAQVHAELGYQQFRLGHYPAAVASYRTVVALRPDSSRYWNIYGGLLLAAGDNAAAELALRRSLALEPNEASLSNLGTLRYQAGDYAAAAGFYRRAAELNPADFTYLGYLGDALEADPRTAQQAREAYGRASTLAQRYVDARPEDAKAMAMLGWFRAQLGDREAALHLAEQAHALGHEPGEVAMLNAQTFAVLGLDTRARDALDAARMAGVPEGRIDTHAVFRRTGVAGPAPADPPPTAVPITGEGT